MNNLWILTEEKPKCSVIFEILNLYCRDFNGKFDFWGNLEVEGKNFPINGSNHRISKLKIKPIFRDMKFQFTYIVEGIFLKDINNIYIKIVSGDSSFLDFLVFKQLNVPSEGQTTNLIMAIEETKTNDDESRNTAVYQRASKFIFIDAYNTSTKTYMLYNNSLGGRMDKKPSDTNIFGTNMLLTLNIDIVGKDTSSWFRPFHSLDDLITFKSQMRKPPMGNVPIDITHYGDKIEISGRLSKPAGTGNIGHDPNIGALSIISKCIRCLGWNGPIIITQHGVSQEYIDRLYKKNKFLYICEILKLQLEGIQMPQVTPLPKNYWHYEINSEKNASILLHIMGEYYGLREVYQNHAGCERGYFITSNKLLLSLPKKDTRGINLYIPDLVLYNHVYNEILLIEGKKLSTLRNGLVEIDLYDSIENEFIRPHYHNAKIMRYLTIFGGYKSDYLHPKVLLYLNKNGQIFINPKSPHYIKYMYFNIRI